VDQSIQAASYVGCMLQDAGRPIVTDV